MGVYLLKKSFFARFLAHNTKNKQTKKARVKHLWTKFSP